MRRGSGDGVENAGLGGGDSGWEIEEVLEPDGGVVALSTETNGGRRDLPHVGDGQPAGEDVYVAVGKGGSSMDALSWALMNQLNSSSGFFYLVHVFPEVHHVPTPLGMLPKNQVSPVQVETYMSQERSKRRELLQKYINLCNSWKVQVDTVLIESDLVAKAILELIPVLRIRKLVMGTSKSSLRTVKRGSGKVGQVVKDVPEYCDIKVICEGQEVKTVDDAASSPSPQDSKEDSGRGSRTLDVDKGCEDDTASCNCFSRKFM